MLVYVGYLSVLTSFLYIYLMMTGDRPLGAVRGR